MLGHPGEWVRRARLGEPAGALKGKGFARSGRYGANNFSMAMEPMQKHLKDDGALGLRI